MKNQFEHIVSTIILESEIARLQLAVHCANTAKKKKNSHWDPALTGHCRGMVADIESNISQNQKCKNGLFIAKLDCYATCNPRVIAYADTDLVNFLLLPEVMKKLLNTGDTAVVNCIHHNSFLYSMEIFFND